MKIKRAIGASVATGSPIAITGTVGYMSGGWSIILSDSYTLGFIYVPAYWAYRLLALLRFSMALTVFIVCLKLILKKIFALISLILSIKVLIQFV